MGCEEIREALSARLDGEEDPTEYAAGPSADLGAVRVDATEAHLAGCADCQRWLDAAASVTRLARTSLSTPWSGVDDSVLQALPQPSTRRRPALVLLRTLLGVLGAGQFVLGVAQIAGIAAVEHGHPELGGASANHLLNESAAWNVAVGAGFAWIALRRSRPSGLLPTLTAFVLVLVLLSATDVAAGWVEPIRLLSHGLLVAGYLIVVALSRPGLDPGEPPATAERGPSRWRLRADWTDRPTQAAPLRLVQRHAPASASAATADRPAA